jgi:opacity protein-like surface antigen
LYPDAARRLSHKEATNVKNWMIRGVLAAFLLVVGLEGQARAQGTSGSIVEALGFVGAVTDGGGATFGGGMQFGADRLIFAAEVGHLTVEGPNTSALSVDLNAHYLFPLANNPKLTPYLLGGIGIIRSSVSVGDFDASDTDAGLNLGGGARIKLNDAWGVRPEIKFLVKDYSNARVSLAIFYAFQ